MFHKLQCMIHKKNLRPVWETPESDFFIFSPPDESAALRPDDIAQWHVEERTSSISSVTVAIYQPRPRRGGSRATSIIHVFFREAGRKKFQSSGGGQGNSFSVPHGPAEHVFIFTVWGLGHMPPRCFTLGTKVSLHPAPIKEHKELFDSLYKPNMTNSRIVYCLIPPLGCHDCVQHTTAAVRLTALCYVCSEKVMICIDHR